MGRVYQIGMFTSIGGAYHVRKLGVGGAYQIRVSCGRSLSNKGSMWLRGFLDKVVTLWGFYVSKKSFSVRSISGVDVGGAY